MKFFVILATLIGLAASQMHDSRCPQGPHDNRPDSFGHEWDCSRFSRCFDGVALELRCPSGQFWSKDLHSCEPEHLSGCVQVIRPLPRPQPIAPPRQDQCPTFDRPGEFVYFPHRTDCQQFFQCSNGHPVQLECPPGFLWNMERTFCDRQQNVRCVTPRM